MRDIHCAAAEGGEGNNHKSVCLAKIAVQSLHSCNYRGVRRPLALTGSGNDISVARLGRSGHYVSAKWVSCAKSISTTSTTATSASLEDFHCALVHGSMHPHTRASCF